MCVWDTVGLLVMTITVNTYTVFINVLKSYRMAWCKLWLNSRDQLCVTGPSPAVLIVVREQGRSEVKPGRWEHCCTARCAVGWPGVLSEP